MRFLILALSLAVSASVAAADIAWHTDRMGPGSHFVMRDERGTVTHVKRGAEQGEQVFDLFSGTGVAAVFLGTYRTNSRGEVTSMIASDGARTLYVPHRCSRTVGRCAFTVVHPDGFREQRLRLTEAVSGGLRYKEYGLDGLLAEGALVLDADGAARAGWKRDKGESRKVRSERVLIASR